MDHGNRLPLDLPALVSELVGSCETNCSAGCCGLDAFDFNDEHVVAWVKEAGMERATEARRQLRELIARISQMDREIFCERVNVYWAPTEAMSFFEMFYGFLGLAEVPGPSDASRAKRPLPPPSVPHPHLIRDDEPNA